MAGAAAAEFVMNYPGFSNAEIATIVGYSIATDCEKARRRFFEENNKEAPPSRTIRHWKTRFMETLSVLPRSKSHNNRSNKLPDDTKEEIVGAFGDGICRSQRDGANQFNVSLGCINKVLKEHKLKAYKYTWVQQLKEEDFPKRLEFCRHVLNNGKEWMKRIIFSDEATLHLNGTVNTHNCYYYSFENEHRYSEIPQKSPGITIWAFIPYDGRIRFRIIHGTMNGDRYLDVIRDIVVPTLQTMRYIHHVYQQDGASVHWTVAAREMLNSQLSGRWIGRSGPIQWPPRSPDLSVNDFWLWGYLRDNVYQLPRATTLPQLAERCEEILGNINHHMVQAAFESFYKRCNLCVQQNGQHFQQLLK